MDLNGLSDSEVTVTQTTTDSKPLALRQTKAASILWISANSQPRRHAAKDLERNRGKSGRAGPRDGMLCFVDSLTARR